MIGLRKHFRDVIDENSFIALVDITRVKKRGSLIQAKCLEIYKGPETDFVEFGVPTLWSYANDWFKKRERCVIVARSDPLISTGYLGRMPLIDRGGMIYIRAYINRANYFTPVEEIRESEDMLLARWEDVRTEFLLGLRS